MVDFTSFEKELSFSFFFVSGNYLLRWWFAMEAWTTRGMWPNSSRRRSFRFFFFRQSEEF